MRDQDRRLQSETNQQVERPSNEQDRIDDALLKMSTRLGRSLTVERIQQWHEDLASYPVEAIEWALDTHARNSKTLPSLADLVQLLKTWYVDEAPQPRCEPECQARHWKGYGTNDVRWLWKKRVQSAVPWSPNDYETAMRELDSKRADGKPTWRQ